MRPSTTSVVTEASVAHEASVATDPPARSRAARAVDRRRIGAVLGAELICAIFLVAGPSGAQSGPAVAAPASIAEPAASATSSPPATTTRTVSTPDGRTAHLVDLGAPGGEALLERIAAELPDATAAVTAFWGADWRRDISIVVAGSADQFAVLAAGGPDIAATTTAQRIMFSPNATAMADGDLRTVLRHELFHYAARSQTAADAPVWLTEGVADFVGRPRTDAAAPASLPTDAQLTASGPERSAAYDRAWEFASHIAHTYDTETLRALYVAACGHGHADIATAVRTVLGVELTEILGTR